MEQLEGFMPLDIGQNGNSWRSRMDGFGSRRVYEDRIYDFSVWLNAHDKNQQNLQDLHESLVEYIEARRKETKADSTPKYCASTLRSWFSIFLMFWKFTGKGDLKTLAPLIDANISKWMKQEEITKSEVFTKDQIGSDFINFIYSFFNFNFVQRHIYA
jgi:hypothetical protein